MTEKNVQKKGLNSRPPIVVVLGHVDHGKTSILEAVKDLKITSKESGGITQHIGAYEIEHKGKKITFIDTPGHEAFSAMRSRGARVADIAILVVAAEEGIKPQTKEAIAHIKKAGIPLIVAINKMDKLEADPERVKRELFQQEVQVESSGGNIPSVEMSATTKKGIEDLLEVILLVAEMEDFRGDFSKPAEGVVIESYMDSKRGVTATLLVRDGVLNKGEVVAAASALGKIRILENFQGESLQKAFPSTPVVAIGLDQVPQVGEKFEVYPDLESARAHIAKKEKKSEEREVVFVENGKKVLNLILKADVRGSVEAITESLKSLPQEKVLLRVLTGEVGDINEGDVKLALSSRALILGFRVKVSPAAEILAEREDVKIRSFDVIYELIQEVRQRMEKSLGTERIKVETGRMKVLAVFLSDKKRQIVGGRVSEGEMRKGSFLELFRGEDFLGKGKAINLQKNKKDADKALRGEECGILYEGEAKVEKGDILVAYTEESKKGEL